MVTFEADPPDCLCPCELERERPDGQARQPIQGRRVDEVEAEGVMANERSMDWDDPAARAQLIEDVGPGEYKRRFEEHCRESTVLVVNGYPIRRIGPLLKRLFLVEGTDTAFQTLAEAKDFAAKQRR